MVAMSLMYSVAHVAHAIHFIRRSCLGRSFTRRASVRPAHKYIPLWYAWVYNDGAILGFSFMSPHQFLWCCWPKQNRLCDIEQKWSESRKAYSASFKLTLTVVFKTPYQSVANCCVRYILDIWQGQARSNISPFRFFQSWLCWSHDTIVRS